MGLGDGYLTGFCIMGFVFKILNLGCVCVCVVGGLCMLVEVSEVLRGRGVGSLGTGVRGSCDLLDEGDRN